MITPLAFRRLSCPDIHSMGPQAETWFIMGHKGSCPWVKTCPPAALCNAQEARTLQGVWKPPSHRMDNRSVRKKAYRTCQQPERRRRPGVLAHQGLHSTCDPKRVS